MISFCLTKVTWIQLFRRAFTLLPVCQEDSLQLPKVLWFLNVMQQRPWFPPGCWTHVQWCEGSGSHRPQGHTGVLKSPKRTIRGVQTSPNPLPQRGAPGAQSPTATSLPKVARCPPTRDRPQGKLAIAVSLTTDAPLTLNLSQAISEPKAFQSSTFLSLRRRGWVGPGPLGQLFLSHANQPQSPGGHPWCSRTRLCAERPGLHPDTFLSRTTF